MRTRSFFLHCSVGIGLKLTCQWVFLQNPHPTTFDQPPRVPAPLQYVREWSHLNYLLFKYIQYLFKSLHVHDVLYAIIFNYSGRIISTIDIFIGPESDHWQCLSLTDSLTNSLTHSRLVNLIDVTLACEDANSKLVEVCYCC